MKYVLPLIFVAGTAAVHPHSHVDQQAALSIGLDRASLSIRIVPSHDESPEILAHIDSDGDGTVPPTEARAFGDAVLSEVLLTVDEAHIALANISVDMSNVAAISSGTGMIEIRAEATYPELIEAGHTIGLSISYEELAHGWLIQPYIFQDAQARYETFKVDRAADGLSINATLQIKG